MTALILDDPEAATCGDDMQLETLSPEGDIDVPTFKEQPTSGALYPERKEHVSSLSRDVDTIH